MTFDFFGDDSAPIDPGGYAGPQNNESVAAAMGENQTSGFDFQELFSNPNFIRAMGEVGAGLGGRGSVGETLGMAGSNLARRKAVQQAGERQMNKHKTLQEKLLEAISSGKLLSAKDQNNAFDSMNLDGDGNVTLSMKNTPQKQGFQRQQPLESIRRSSEGGSDLPDFSNQPGGNFDFAGLDPGDVSLLLKAEQQFGQLDQNQMKMVLNEKTRRSTIAESSKRRTEDLRQLGLDRTAKVEAKRLETEEKKNIAGTLAESKLALAERKSALKVNADKLSPTELAVEELELRKLTKEVENLESGEGDVTPAQQATIDKNNADLARKETELGMKLDKLEKEEFFSIQPSFVDAKGNEIDVEFEERAANARQSNHRPNNKVFYNITQPIVTEFFDGKADQDGNVVPVFLPKHPTTGKQITTTDVLDTAKANGISPDEVLRQWGLIK